MREIAVRTQFVDEVDTDEIREVLDGALRNQAELADERRVYFKQTCLAFERQYQISSQEFMRQFESGALGDDVDYFDWYAAKRGLDLWERRFNILSGVQV